MTRYGSRPSGEDSSDNLVRIERPDGSGALEFHGHAGMLILGIITVSGSPISRRFAGSSRLSEATS